MIEIKKGRGNKKASDEQVVAAYTQTGSVHKAALMLGMCHQSVHERLVKMGHNKGINVFTEADADRLRRDYQDFRRLAQLELLAKSMGRTKQFICRQAKAMGLTRPEGQAVYVDPVRLSRQSKKWHSENPHPRGALGMRHSESAKLKMSWMSRARWSSMTPEKRTATTRMQLETKLAKYGTLAVPRLKTTWKQGWREIAGNRIYFRSRWEFNYAVYLQFLVDREEISKWEHEPQTFWFEGIKRGCVTYLPDFRITNKDNSVEYHEVKGWMDDRSKTKLRRMKKYHPTVKLRIIDGKWFKANTAKLSFLKGWEK